MTDGKNYKDIKTNRKLTRRRRRSNENGQMTEHRKGEKILQETKEE
jgi:hypothetical protein